MSSLVKYRGERLTATGECRVVKVQPNGNLVPLKPWVELWNHSPTGFNWGYGGSGPAQLALALIMDATGDPDLAKDHHQRFKWAFVCHLAGDRWEISADFVCQVVDFWETVCWGD